MVLNKFNVISFVNKNIINVNYKKIIGANAFV